MKCILAGSALCAVALLAQTATHKTTRADVAKWMSSLSNAGRWGTQDRRGTANLISDAKRREAAAMIKDGVAISMAHDVLKEKALDNPNPFVHNVPFTGQNPNGEWMLDNYAVAYHGPAHT